MPESSFTIDVPLLISVVLTVAMFAAAWKLDGVARDLIRSFRERLKPKR